MKVSSRVSELGWSWEPSVLQSRLDSWSTKCTVSKIEQLVKHIVAFREELAEVSSMAQDLEQLLEAQLSITSKKSQREI